jgi:hypothetical protein
MGAMYALSTNQIDRIKARRKSNFDSCSVICGRTKAGMIRNNEDVEGGAEEAGP